MQVFQPCQISWSGRSELRTLIKFEPVGNALQLVGERLFSGFYVNELTMRMTTRQDPNLELYSVYQQTILSLARTSVAIELILRRFEKSLLDACGYGMQLLAEANSGADIDPTQSYCYAVEYGPDPSSNAPDGIVVSGQTLLALAGRREFEVDELREAKRLMRFVLRHYIGDRPLSSRSLFRKPNRNNHSPK